MAGRIDSFWAQLNAEGISKNSHWDVQINIPDALRGSAVVGSFPGIERTMAFRCEAGELPGRQLVTSDQKIYGPVYRTAYQSLYTDLNLTFLETSELSVRQFMEAWMDAIFDSGSNILQYQKSYQTTIIVTQYHVEADQPVQTSTTPGAGDFAPQPNSGAPVGVIPSLYMYMHNAYPVNINQMTTAWSDDSPHRVQVTFFYEWYTMSPAPRTTLGQSQGAPESNRKIAAPVGLYDTATDWLSRTRKRFF